MAQFKVGDRVRSTLSCDELAIGDEGTIVETTGTSGWVRMDNPRGVQPIPDKGGAHWSFGSWLSNEPWLELVEPRKNTPAVGDTVRVVLEGKVSLVDSDGFGVGAHGNLADNYVVPNQEHVKSIEIITPAKPSVRDLPTFTPVKVGPDVFVRVGSGWYVTGGLGLYTDDQIDAMNWVRLVPKESE